MKDVQKGFVENYITVRFQFEGFHRWKDAPDEVAFLRNTHRHMFVCDSSIQVFTEDRELEYFMVQQLIAREILPFIQLGDGNESCEIMANRLLKGLIKAYGGHRRYRVTVSEDGENSSTAVYKLAEPW